MAGSLRFLYKTLAEDFDKALRDRYEPVADAVTDAMHRGGGEFRAEGRAHIASAGGRFGKGWQGGWRVNVFPRRRTSINAAIYGFHKIRYSGIFEEGGRIGGKPLLWLPFTGVPTTKGGRVLTASRFDKEVAPLQTIKGARIPLLGARTSLLKSGKVGKLSLRKFRNRGGRGRIVPVYFGVRTVTISKTFDLAGVAESIARRIPGYYYDAFKDA